ncbi:MAG: 30S ribosomal protein S8 [Chloroflexota bacterium]
MSMSDPIADMLTRVRNALQRQHPTVSMPTSKMKTAVADVMKKEGYIEDFQVVDEKPQGILQIKLKYIGGRRDKFSVITGIERVSKPGRRVYVTKQDVPWVLSGMGVAILTTSKGILTDQEARKAGVGGEVLCNIW